MPVNGINGSYRPNQFYSRGDTVTSDSGGDWVCLVPHTAGSGNQFPLKKGESTMVWHWSTGPSLPGTTT